MHLRLLALTLGSAAGLAEYYNQSIIPYGGLEVNENYSESVPDESLEYYRPMLRMGVNNLEERSGFPDIDAQRIRSPEGAIQSLKVGRFKTNPEDIGNVLHREMADMSPDLHSRLTKTLAHSNVDHTKYRDLFLIKKRVTDDGRRRIINFNIKEKIIPRDSQESLAISRDFGMRALLGGIMFLLAGLVFTTTLKMYQGIIKKSYFNIEDKVDMFEKQ